jgi:hypothetical protein
MGTRHGTVARTPASPADAASLAGRGSAGPARPPVAGGREGATRAELGRLAEALLDQPTSQQRWRQARALARVLDWLDGFPGADWQQRWLASGAEADGQRWGPAGLTQAQRCRFTAGLGTLIVLRAVRPSYAWLSASRLLGVYAAFRRHNQAGAFAGLERQAAQRGGGEYAAEALNLLTRMVIVTSRQLADLDLADFDDYTRARAAAGRKVASLPFAYECLHAVGGLAGLPPTLRQARARGQLPVADLVGRYPVANREVRDLLVHYLAERSAALDYASLVNHVQVLAGLFWCDLEAHHPGIASLHLPDAVAQAWKQRVRTLPDGSPRRTVHTVFFAVRAFYLELLQWSLEDPARWGRWAAPCPVGEADTRGYVKETRRRQARMQERTRTLIPVLPRLVEAAEAQWEQASRVLAAARQTPPGEEFTAAGERLLGTGAPAGRPATGGPRRCSPPRPARTGRGSTPNAARTTPSGPSPPWGCCAAPGCASRNSSRPPT